MDRSLPGTDSNPDDLQMQNCFSSNFDVPLLSDHLPEQLLQGDME